MEEDEIQYEQTTPVVLATAEDLTDPEVEKYLYTNECSGQLTTHPEPCRP